MIKKNQFVNKIYEPLGIYDYPSMKVMFYKRYDGSYQKKNNNNTKRYDGISNQENQKEES